MKRVINGYSAKECFFSSYKEIIVLIFILLFAGANQSISQTKTWTGNSGSNWSSAGNWNPAGVPGADDDIVISTTVTIIMDFVSTATINSFTINNNATVTLSSSGTTRNLIIDNTGSSITTGSTLVILGSSVTQVYTISFSGTGETVSIYGTLNLKTFSIYNATNSTTTVSGTITNDGGTVTATPENLKFNSGSTYTHNMNGGTIPAADWDAASTLNVTGITSTIADGFSQTFGNFIWNCTGQSTDIILPSIGVVVVNGNMDIQNTHNKFLRQSQSQRTLDIQGNLTIQNSKLQIGNSQTLHSVNVSGDVNILSGVYLYIADGKDNKGELNVHGNFNLSSGYVYINANYANDGKLRLYKNYTRIGGEMSGSSDTLNLCSLIFAGTDVQTYTDTDTTGNLKNIIDVIVNSGSTLNAGICVIGGSSSTGKFDLLAGAGLMTSKKYGLDAKLGAIRTQGTITLDTNSNITFYGSEVQSTGSTKSLKLNNVTINNPAGVNLAGSFTIYGILDLASGALSLNEKTLNINGSVTRTAGILAGNTYSTLTIGGTGALGTIAFKEGTASLNTLTMNRALGSVNFSQNLNVTSTLNLSNGVIDMGTNTLMLGTSATSTGTLNPSTPTSSSYIIGNFERWFKASTNSAGVWFPVGSSTKFRPAIIQFTSAPTKGGKIKVAGYSSNPGTVNPTESIVDNGYTINRYSQEAWWKITPTDITGGTYTLSLGAYGITGVGNNTLLRVLKRADSQQPWGFSGNHTTGTGTNSEPMVNRSGITGGFSEFGIGGNSADGNPLNDIPLPVVMKMFMSEVSGNGVR
ncbi:MAG TPA: hypothetical protein PK447_08435, partial [Ignavibacteria bacterium]|nr:hypothetical protein [Ignavibacteria bacterium]